MSDLGEVEDCWDVWFDGLALALRSGAAPDQRRILEPVAAIQYRPHVNLLEALPFPIGSWVDDED